MTDKPASLENLLSRLEEARSAYNAAAARENGARREATAALNELNQCMKDVDAAIDRLRKDSPRGSDWAERMRGV